MRSAAVLWDGKDFAAVQMLFAGIPRPAGEPLCRLPGGDMSRMQVMTARGWVQVVPGEIISVPGNFAEVTVPDA